MLSNGFARPLHLRRKPSRLLAGYLLSLHVLAVLALLQPLNIATATHLLLYGVLLGSAGFHVAYFRRQRDQASAYWVWQAGGAWLRTDKEQPFSLVRGRVVQTPWFVTLTLVAPAQPRQRLLIVRDQVDADTYRRLRVRLQLYHEDVAVKREEAG